MDFLLVLLKDTVKIIFTVWMTAYVNKWVKKHGKKRKRTAFFKAGKLKSGSKRKAR
jgi:predicted lipase